MLTTKIITPRICFLLAFLVCSIETSQSSHQEKKGHRYRIISGRQADISEFPYQASIEYHYNQWCGGSIIGPRAILTAAHCVVSMKSMKNIPQRLMLVRLGNSVSSTGGKVHSIKRFIVHKRYGENPSVDEHDVAIIVLAKPIKFTSSIKPIDLSKVEPKAGEMSWVTGFGRQEPMKRSSGSRHLMAVEIPIMDREQCKGIHRPYGNIVTDKMICAGFDSGSRDSCKGDSGGPLASKDKLVGVVAWGMGCGRDGIPGVYTSVPKYYNWIMCHLREIEAESGGISRNGTNDSKDGSTV